jgi:hypothetical protein
VYWRKDPWQMVLLRNRLFKRAAFYRQGEGAIMETTRIILAGIWTAVMLIFLLGDVLRIFAGHVVSGEIAGMEASQLVWIVIATIMLTPILMIVLNLTVSYPAIRWINIVLAIFWILFNIVGMLGGYSGAYDYYLLFVSMIFNGVTIWYAWKWV